MVIDTHFDIDHAGHNNAFPNAELIVQRQHYESAQGGNPRFARSRSQWDLSSSQYRFVDGDTELLPGLELIETSGYVPGHQSVLVRLPETGPVYSQLVQSSGRKISRLNAKLVQWTLTQMVCERVRRNCLI